MSTINIIVNILAALALIIIGGYVISLIYKYLKNRTKQHIATLMNPPGAYMQNSGIKCPDYWVNTGIDSNGNYICKNSFNIDTHALDGCKIDELTFPPVASGYTWELNDPNNLTSYSNEEKYDFLNTSVNNSITRCQWINRCGANKNVQGIWSGVNELCNNPPTS